MPEEKKNIMTTDAGHPVGDNQNSLTVGPRGPVVFEDFLLFEKMAHFNRERIPERVVHAKGSGAYGHFICTSAEITKYTTAKLFNAVGKKTPTFIRFSTVGGEKGSADTARDPRGFALKFYTEEGNWDMTGNNTPVFFIRDPLKFGDFIHTQKRDPETNLKSPTMMWDFWSLSPESLHQVTILFSDRGTPDGYRHMNGYSSHTFSLINAKNELFYVKWHFKTKQGIKNFFREQAGALEGTDPDYSQRDLFHAIQKGDFPKWRVCVQIMPEKDAETYHINPFDLTKVWPHRDYPLHEVGELELNRNPENYFAEVEQAAFEPRNVAPGMGFSPDKMLQARLISYPDAHRYRLGVNYDSLPVNKPQCPYHTYNKDGAMRFDGNRTATCDQWNRRTARSSDGYRLLHAAWESFPADAGGRQAAFDWQHRLQPRQRRAAAYPRTANPALLQSRSGIRHGRGNGAGAKYRIDRREGETGQRGGLICFAGAQHAAPPN